MGAVFAVIWIFPTACYVMPINNRNVNGINFAKDILLNLTGLTTTVIGRFSSGISENDIEDEVKYVPYATIDSNLDRNVTLSTFLPPAFDSVASDTSGNKWGKNQNGNYREDTLNQSETPST